MNTRPHGIWFIILSFVIGIVLELVPLPAWLNLYRPTWIAMLMVYWMVYHPERVGLTVALCLGLFLDVLNGTSLGLHALTLIIIVYLTSRIALQMRFFPLLQQVPIVFLLILLYEFMMVLLRGSMGYVVDLKHFWMPALSSMVLWPWVAVLLGEFSRKVRVQ